MSNGREFERFMHADSLRRDTVQWVNTHFFMGSQLTNLCLPVRINAELPWTVILFGIIGTIVTFSAWYRRPKYIPDAIAKPSTESIECETRVVGGGLHDVEALTRNITS